MILKLKRTTYVDLVLASNYLPFETGLDEGVRVIQLLLHIHFDQDLLHRSPKRLAHRLGMDLGWCSRITNRMLREGLLEREESEVETLLGGPTNDPKAPRALKNLILTLDGVGVIEKLRDEAGLFWFDGKTEWTLKR